MALSNFMTSMWSMMVIEEEEMLDFEAESYGYAKITSTLLSNALENLKANKN